MTLTFTIDLHLRPLSTDVIPAPFDLRVGDITANGATVTWTPGDSCLHHAIFVNNIEVRVLKPAVFSHTLTGNAMLGRCTFPH